jgi:hypothetical protein
MIDDEKRDSGSVEYVSFIRRKEKEAGSSFLFFFFFFPIDLLMCLDPHPSLLKSKIAIP